MSHDLLGSWRQRASHKQPRQRFPIIFAELDDPRVERTRHHKLVDILAISIGATICGADSWVHMELFGKGKLS